MKKEDITYHCTFGVESHLIESDINTKKMLEHMNIESTVKEFREYLVENKNKNRVTNPYCNNKEYDELSNSIKCQGHKTCICLIAIKPDEGSITPFYKDEKLPNEDENKGLVKFNYCPFCGERIKK